MLRVCVIGLGHIGNLHARIYQEDELVDLVGVCDIIEERAAAASKKLGVPYWLDGFVPLAYLLEDEDLIARAKRYIEAILSAQREDGWICPCSDEERAGYDVWAVFLICKALMVYGECSGDTRAETAVYRALQNLHGHLRKHTLFNWGQSRWFECLIPLKWLWDKQPEEWMLRLAVTLRTQGLDWETLFSVCNPPVSTPATSLFRYRFLTVLRSTRLVRSSTL